MSPARLRAPSHFRRVLLFTSLTWPCGGPYGVIIYGYLVTCNRRHNYRANGPETEAVTSKGTKDARRPLNLAYGSGPKDDDDDDCDHELTIRMPWFALTPREELFSSALGSISYFDSSRPVSCEID